MRRNMSKVISVVLTMSLALSMCACSAKSSVDTEDTTAEVETEIETETEEETEEETVDASGNDPSGNDVSDNDVSENDAEEETKDGTESESEDSPESKTKSASEEEEEESPEEESTNSKTSEKDSTKSETTTSETTTEAVTVQSVSAVVSGTHYVGETLTGADFTVTVKMSDGETLTNPDGWSAQPLTLSSTSNLITVAYEGASVTITVEASVQTASNSGSSSATSTTSTTTSATTQVTTASTTAASATVYSFDSVEGTFQYSTSGTGLASKTPYYFYVTDSSYWDCTYKVGDTIDVTDIVASLWYYTDDGGYAVYNMTDSQKQKITLSSNNVTSLEGERITATYEGMSFTTTVTAYEGLVDKSYAIEAFNTFNEWRAEAGLSQLIWSDELYEIACIRAEELSTNFSHEEDFLPGAINAIGYNVASLIDGWKNSAPHYAFIMADYEEYYWAVAFYKTGGTYTGTGIFTNSYDTISSGRYLIRDADV